jgi:hypothetical protein
VPGAASASSSQTPPSSQHRRPQGRSLQVMIGSQGAASATLGTAMDSASKTMDVNLCCIPQWRISGLQFGFGTSKKS